MTTKNFSAIKLPHPRYKLEVGKFNLYPSTRQELVIEKQQSLGREQAITDNVDSNPDNVEEQQVTRLLPRYIHKAHVIEVKEPGYTIPGCFGSHIKNFLGSHVVITDARPELFLRRDFIRKFVERGRVFVSHIPDDSNPGYKLTITADSRMLITMNAKQYRRFGLVAKKVISLAAENFGTKEKCYRVEINLRDERIMKNNRYQDKLVNLLRRLSPINKVYFRFIPEDKSASSLSISEANELSVEFFKYVIEEYALDGCQPVPLTNCSAISQKIERHKLNCSQLHPRLDLAHIVRDDGKLSLDKDGGDKLAELVELVDWLGYQLLSLDCDMSEIKSNYPDGGNPRYDVSCTHIVGAIDYQHIEYNLPILFGTSEGRRAEDEGVVLRALILFEDHNEHISSSAQASLENVSPYSNVGNTSGVAYIQDCIHGSKVANEITVIGMAALAG